MTKKHPATYAGCLKCGTFVIFLDKFFVVNHNIILIVAENPFFLTMFKDKHNARTLGDAIQNILGKRYVIRAKCSAAAAKPRPVQEMIEKAKNSGITTTAVT